MPKKSVGHPRSVRTTENIITVRISIKQSPSRFDHASALGMSDRIVTRILNCDFKLHLFEIMVARELSTEYSRLGNMKRLM